MGEEKGEMKKEEGKIRGHNERHLGGNYSTAGNWLRLAVG